MKRSFTIFAWLLMAGTYLHAQDGKLLDETFLSSLRAEAASSHPAAAAAKFRANAAAEDVRAVRLWNDPMVGLSYMAAEKMMRRSDGDIILGLDQALPKPGLFTANREKAEAMHRAEIETSRSTTLEVGAMAGKSAIELALTDEVIALQASQIQWLDSMAENARQRAANPDSSSIEALRLESELTREIQILDAAKRTRASLAQKLNLTLGRPLDKPWPVLKLPASPPPVPMAVAEIARISRANPKVRAMKETASAAKAETHITKRERLPDVSVGVETAIFSGTGDVRSSTFGVKMSLPWFNDSSYSARTDAARIREKSAIADIETLHHEIAGNVLSAVADAANAAAQAHAYSGEVYERTLQATKTIEASWISSKSPLTDLLESNKMLFSIRLEQRRFIALELAALEELNLLVPNSH
jgi:outer membrane protein TolC